MAEKQMEHNATCKSEGHNKHLCNLIMKVFILATRKNTKKSSRIPTLDVRIAAEPSIKVKIFANRSLYEIFAFSCDIACAILGILSDDSSSLGMRMRAYRYGRKMAWPKVAEAYLRVFEEESAPASMPSWPRPSFSHSKIPVDSRQCVSESA